MKTTDHELFRQSIAGCLSLRARPVARALAEIGVAAALVMPAPMALAAEASVPILAREAVRTTIAHSRSEGLLNDAKGVAVSTATKRQKTASYGVELYDTYFSPSQRLVGEKSTLHLYFSNAGGLGYGSFEFNANTVALPSGVVVASPVVTGNSCGGTLAPAAGAASIAFPAFTMTDDDTCYFGVEVAVTTAGAKLLQPTFTGVFNDGGPSLVTVVSSDEARLNVPGAGGSFSPTSVSPGESATLTFTIGNPYPYMELHVDGAIGLGTLAATGAVSTTCTVEESESAPYVSGSFLHIDGISVDPDDSCTVSLAVSSSTPGSYTVPSPATSLSAYYFCGPMCDFFYFSEKGKSAKGKGAKTGFSIPVSSATLVVASGPPPPAPVLSVPMTSIVFPATPVGSVSAPVDVEVKNVGNAALTFFGSVAPTGPFGVVNGCPVAPATLAAGASCVRSVSFKPTSPGSQVGELLVASDAGNLRVSLSGSGIPASPTVSKSFSPGSVVAGANSTLTVSLSNPNSAPMTGLGFADTFPTGLASSGTVANNCGGTASGGTGLSLSGGQLQANGGCQVSIQVNASTSGSYTNTIAAGAVTGLVDTVTVTNAAGASAVLEVTPAPAPGVGLSPASLDFGAVTINAVSGAKRATITNTGAAALNFAGAFGVTGPFSHTSGCPASLAPTQGCTVDVTFAPTAVGPASGSLSVASNAPGSPHSLPLSGTGDPLPVAGVSFSPASLSFAGQTVATTSSAQGLTLTNSGGLPLAISGIGTGGDFAQSNNCPASLAPGGSCPISVTFTPLVTGTRTGSLTVASNAPGSPHAAGLTGLGVAIPAPTVSVTPSPLAFPATQLGTTSGTFLVQVRNTGNAQLVFSGFDIVGTGFILTANTCNVPVGAGGECAIGIVFAPPALGAASATLRLTGNMPGGPSFVGLTGTGIPVPVATLTATPGSLVFAERVVGTPSAVLEVAISNSGTVAAAIGGIGISGDYAATTTCGSSLAVGANCVASVIFTPTAVGERSGALAIVDTAANALLTVALSGRGAPLPVPVIEVSATSLTFGNTTIPGASTPQSFTVRNAGGAPLSVTSLAVTGEFVATGCGAPLAAGADCRVDVTFTPHVPGPRTGTLSILSNASNGTPSVNLAGTGCRFNFRTFALICQ